MTSDYTAIWAVQVVPRILWRYFRRHSSWTNGSGFHSYPEFEDFSRKPHGTLNEYLELHTLVEIIPNRQTLHRYLSLADSLALPFWKIWHIWVRYAVSAVTYSLASRRIDLMAELLKLSEKLVVPVSDCNESNSMYARHHMQWMSNCY